jgi:error-prone DNA polymerase
VAQLAAFADYGFPESHAASFALLVYASAHLRHHFMPEFYAAMLNAQPMGFYSPASLVEDAKRHGVEVRPPDVSFSQWDCTIEATSEARSPTCDFQESREGKSHETAAAGPRSRPFVPPPDCENPLAYRDHPLALRVGLRYVRGLGASTRDRVERAIAPRPRSIGEFVTRVDLPEHLLLDMAAAGVFDSLEGERRRAVWEVLRLAKGRIGPLDLPGIERDAPTLPLPTAAELVAADRTRVGLSPRTHPMAFLRGELDARGVVTASGLRGTRRRHVRIAGIVVCRQRPPTAKGFVFLTLEDEGGMINVVVEPALFDVARRTIVGNPALEIDGVLERQDNVLNVKARGVRPLTLAAPDGVQSRDFH